MMNDPGWLSKSIAIIYVLSLVSKKGRGCIGDSADNNRSREVVECRWLAPTEQ